MFDTTARSKCMRFGYTLLSDYVCVTKQSRRGTFFFFFFFGGGGGGGLRHLFSGSKGNFV